MTARVEQRGRSFCRCAHRGRTIGPAQPAAQGRAGSPLDAAIFRDESPSAARRPAESPPFDSKYPNGWDNVSVVKISNGPCRMPHSSDPATITTAMIADLYAYWLKQRNGRRMPRRADIDPADIK